MQSFFSYPMTTPIFLGTRRSRGDCDDNDEDLELLFACMGMHPTQRAAALQACGTHLVMRLSDLRLLAIDDSFAELFPQLSIRVRIQAWLRDNPPRPQQQRQRPILPTFEIHVKMLVGTTVVLNVTEEMKVWELKERIREKGGPLEMLLIHDATFRPLKDNQESLGNYGITASARRKRIHVTLSFRTITLWEELDDQDSHGSS